ncbi:hypothetical protein, variant 6 [Exophiala xenobiotica]|uniref:Plastocyanin-like domain-containing protein n=1 Tax=Exophiala xenobiotica TaxID=348802 RepID=A0A0D2EW38_9EURO|nr:hypothetical protein, variant 4 [Exophiala xenobiotica]XP_013312612.1 hypothetical protein, variant 5 [Exophiala xenobiotica]XP_013312613.1 hypothetical protein, variant 6 [Exophiala xenobiotica]KIW52028.1 hypothetical protein, variant 4 [Exophiala xenobiotica]KIW52029.1 hypothetical protein, variant 5 [Exophiala xenobiotica]KIW52030.1 hypothetical protein, variant 6 [Exophiala xenobiotica]
MQFPIPPQGNFTYRFSTGSEYGIYWYHSHFRAYYNDAVRGPLLIHPSPSRRRPFESLARDSTELEVMLQAERAATPLLLTDWYHRLSDVIYDEYFTTGAFPQCVDSLLANGYGRVQCLPESILQAGPGLGLESIVASDPHDPLSTPMPTASYTMSDMLMDTMSSSSTSMDSMSMDTSMSMHKRSDHATITAADSTVSGGLSMLPATNTSTSSMATVSGIADMSSLGPKGCSMQMMFKPGFNASSLPPEICSNTTSEQFMFDVDASQGWAAVHLVNAGAVSRLSVSLDGHSMFVYAADGLYVEPQEVQVLHISIGQRYSVMVRFDQKPGNYYLRFASYPYGDMQQVIEGQAILSYQTNGTNMTNMGTVDDATLTWMLVNGSAMLNASELDGQKLAPYEGNVPPSGPSDVTQLFAIGQTDVVTWVINSQPFSEPQRPILYGNASDGWDAVTTLHMPSNSTIDLIMYVATDSMDTMGHPMHLHGHKFWLLGSGAGVFPYLSVTDAPSSMINLNNPPYRDTIDLPPSGWAVIRYITDNPGAWLFHCHVQWHQVSGMAVVLVEDEERMQSMVGSIEDAANNPDATARGTSMARRIVIPTLSYSVAFYAAVVSLLLR